jgi:hypothetical protein
MVSLQAFNGRFLVAEVGGALNANRSNPLEWERFLLIDPLNPTSEATLQFGDPVALRSAHGTYVVAEEDGSTNSNRQVLGPWETWSLLDPRDLEATGPVDARDQVALRSFHGGHLVAEPNGQANANRLAVSTWERWRVGRTGSDFYYDEPSPCPPGACCPCPDRGRFDGANCFVSKPPEAKQPFLWVNNFYYSQGGEPGCALGSFDGANCQVGSNPEEAVPFLYRQGFYLLSACDPKYRWTPWESRSNAAGTLQGRAKHRKINLRWVVEPEYVDPAKVISIKICMKEARSSQDICKKPVRIISGWTDNVYLHDLKAGQKYRFEVRISQSGRFTYKIGKKIYVTTK